MTEEEKPLIETFRGDDRGAAKGIFKIKNKILTSSEDKGLECQHFSLITDYSSLPLIADEFSQDGIRGDERRLEGDEVVQEGVEAVGF